MRYKYRWGQLRVTAGKTRNIPRLRERSTWVLAATVKRSCVQVRVFLMAPFNSGTCETCNVRATTVMCQFRNYRWQTIIHDPSRRHPHYRGHLPPGRCGWAMKRSRNELGRKWKMNISREGERNSWRATTASEHWGEKLERAYIYEAYCKKDHTWILSRMVIYNYAYNYIVCNTRECNLY